MQFDDAINRFTSSFSIDDGIEFTVLGSYDPDNLEQTEFGFWQINAFNENHFKACKDFFDGDGNSDGKDLKAFIADSKGISLEEMAQMFGQTRCL